MEWIKDIEEQKMLESFEKPLAVWKLLFKCLEVSINSKEGTDCSPSQAFRFEVTKKLYTVESSGYKTK